MKVEKALVGGLASVAALTAGSQIASAQDWTGAYAGISVNSNSGTLPWSYPYDDYKLESGAVAGAFVGARWAAGNFLVGTELAFQGAIGGDANGDSSYPEDYGFSSLIDLKLSLGKPIGRTLVYGFAGLSSGNVTASSSGQNYTAFGANFGLGADYRVSDMFSVGAEYTHRIMSGYDTTNASNGTLALRASFHF